MPLILFYMMMYGRLTSKPVSDFCREIKSLIRNIVDATAGRLSREMTHTLQVSALFLVLTVSWITASGYQQYEPEKFSGEVYYVFCLSIDRFVFF